MTYIAHKFFVVYREGEYKLEQYDDDYMPTDVPLAKGYSRFIDAGAYQGKNGLAINEKFGSLEYVAFIEPDATNMIELKERIKDSKFKNKSLFF